MADMFDWNGDGKLDHWEEANKALFIYNQTHPESAKQKSRSDSGEREYKSGIGRFFLAFLVFCILFHALFR